jgi:CyaY protein
MNDAIYRELTETLYNLIEERIDTLIEDSDLALDYENNSGVLTILCEDTNTQVIISRQRASHEVWVAAKSGGFHCNYKNDEWFCSKTNESLSALLSRTCSEQSSSPVDFYNL